MLVGSTRGNILGFRLAAKKSLFRTLLFPTNSTNGMYMRFNMIKKSFAFQPRRFQRMSGVFMCLRLQRPNPSVKRDCATSLASPTSRFRAAAPYLQRYLFVVGQFWWVCAHPFGLAPKPCPGLSPAFSATSVFAVWGNPPITRL